MALSRVVSEIFNVEKCRDVEIGVRRLTMAGNFWQAMPQRLQTL